MNSLPENFVKASLARPENLDILILLNKHSQLRHQDILDYLVTQFDLPKSTACYRIKWMVEKGLINRTEISSRRVYYQINRNHIQHLYQILKILGRVKLENSGDNESIEVIYGRNITQDLFFKKLSLNK